VSSRRASPTLIGAFVVGGLALLIIALMVLAGGELLQRRERAVMFFDNSIYGLQVGAPVVFRGVQVGHVSSIGVLYDGGADDFAIPVYAEFEGGAIRGMDGRRAGVQVGLPALVQRGLRARLRMQSLLTGQLYVDLDLRADQQGALRGVDGTGTVEIPTTRTAIQSLQSEFDGVDLSRLTDDISAIAASAKALVAGPQLHQALNDVREITSRMRSLAERADRRLDPLANDASAALQGTRSAMDRIGRAAEDVSRAADRLDTASAGAAALLAPDSALVKDLRGAADQLAQAAASVRRGTSEDGPLLRSAEHALDDVSRAARALRELAELLERQPDALLRGRTRERQ
jgi:paraquat-inducible protein B